MPAFVINQEAFLDLYAARLQKDRNNLSDQEIRFGLAQYHAVYLPTAAVIEVRSNELDKQQLYQSFGFSPNTSTLATATLQVQVAVAPSGLPYHLPAPFVVEQNGRTFTATEDLTFEVGQTEAEVEIRAQTQGSLGTPVDGTARISSSVGWLRGAIIQIDNITPGVDGDDAETIASNFRAFVANPESLVRAVDHADWLMDNRDDVGRAIATARVEVSYDGSTWTKGVGTAGHLTVAVLDPDAGIPDPGVIDSIKADLLDETVPYGDDTLHVVPANRPDITGDITVKAQAGTDIENLKIAIINRLNEHLSWETWQHGRHVYAGDLWVVISGVGGVDHVQSVSLNGSLIGGGVSTEVHELDVYELPRGAFNTSMVNIA